MNDPRPGVGVGVLYHLGTHLIDQAVMLFGGPSSVYAEVASRRDRTDVDDDDVFVAFDYPRALRVHLWMSAVAADQGPRFRLLGDTAAYVKTGMDVQETHLSEERAPGGPYWGEELEASWGHIVAGGDRRGSHLARRLSALLQRNGFAPPRRRSPSRCDGGRHRHSRNH